MAAVKARVDDQELAIDTSWAAPYLGNARLRLSVVADSEEQWLPSLLEGSLSLPYTSACRAIHVAKNKANSPLSDGNEG